MNYLHFTWISLGEVKVGEIDNIVCFLLFLVEESQLCWSSHNIVRDDALMKSVTSEIMQNISRL